MNLVTWINAFRAVSDLEILSAFQTAFLLTRLFFDLIDRRYNKEGNFNMIFTSNKNPALWREDFDEDATLLCALDRIFDDATVFKLRGESFRGKKLETVSLQTGKVQAVEPLPQQEE